MNWTLDMRRFTSSVKPEWFLQENVFSMHSYQWPLSSHGCDFAVIHSKECHNNYREDIIIHT